MKHTDEQWNRIESIILPIKPSKDPRGRKDRDSQEVLNGILRILRTVAIGKDLPHQYPPELTLGKSPTLRQCAELKTCTAETKMWQSAHALPHFASFWWIRSGKVKNFKSG